MALDSVLKADVWRDHLLREEATLNAKLAELEGEGDEKRIEDAREEFSARLAEVHERLTEMDAESGPSIPSLTMSEIHATINGFQYVLILRHSCIIGINTLLR